MYPPIGKQKVREGKNDTSEAKLADFKRGVMNNRRRKRIRNRLCEQIGKVTFDIRCVV